MRFLSIVLILFSSNVLFASAARATSEDCFETNGTSTITKFLCGYSGDTRVVVPKSIRGMTVTEIGPHAFSHMALTNVELPDGLKSIGSWAFSGNQLEDLVLPLGLVSIGDVAFGWSQLKSVAFPNTVVSIGEAAFRGNQLTHVALPDSVTTLGDGVFEENMLEDVKIGRAHV